MHYANKIVASSEIKINERNKTIDMSDLLRDKGNKLIKLIEKEKKHYNIRHIFLFAPPLTDIPPSPYIYFFCFPLTRFALYPFNSSLFAWPLTLSAWPQPPSFSPATAVTSWHCRPSPAAEPECQPLYLLPPPSILSFGCFNRWDPKPFLLVVFIFWFKTVVSVIVWCEHYYFVV